jgi:hypothetical protein
MRTFSISMFMTLVGLILVTGSAGYVFAGDNSAWQTMNGIQKTWSTDGLWSVHASGSLDPIAANSAIAPLIRGTAARSHPSQIVRASVSQIPVSTCINVQASRATAVCQMNHRLDDSLRFPDIRITRLIIPSMLNPDETRARSENSQISPDFTMPGPRASGGTRGWIVPSGANRTGGNRPAITTPRNARAATISAQPGKSLGMTSGGHGTMTRAAGTQKHRGFQARNASSFSAHRSSPR